MGILEWVGLVIATGVGWVLYIRERGRRKGIEWALKEVCENMIFTGEEGNIEKVLEKIGKKLE